MFASSGEITAPGACPCEGGGRSHFPWLHLPVFRHPGLQPFADQAYYAPIADTVFDEFDQPVVADRIEKASDVGIQNPVHLAPVDPNRQRVQRIVLTAPRPEPVAEPQEVLFPDCVQHFHQRTLDYLVFQRCDAQRPLSSVRLRYIDKPDGPAR
jgi:hypothetical protein